MNFAGFPDGVADAPEEFDDVVGAGFGVDGDRAVFEGEFGEDVQVAIFVFETPIVDAVAIAVEADDDAFVGEVANGDDGYALLHQGQIRRGEGCW